MKKQGKKMVMKESSEEKKEMKMGEMKHEDFGKVKEKAMKRMMKKAC